MSEPSFQEKAEMNCSEATPDFISWLECHRQRGTRTIPYLTVTHEFLERLLIGNGVSTFPPSSEWMSKSPERTD